jgi:hypothetical protein
MWRKNRREAERKAKNEARLKREAAKKSEGTVRRNTSLFLVFLHCNCALSAVDELERKMKETEQRVSQMLSVISSVNSRIVKERRTRPKLPQYDDEEDD